MRLKASLAGGTKERRTLMDIEKLIEQLNGYFEGKDLKRGVALDAATALSALQAENEKLRAELEQVKKKNKYSAHDVALILSDAFGDSCACNFNGNDEWLPEKCELLDVCPDVVGVACWEQYLKWLGQKED